ncbi:hypothetical protein EV700_0263 [Fluviicoccus keumensis]|uniref:Uncharacterized protein n=1 Tax=Fluviicoccus keumensis TaxID=1435465 RepID=A0A4Q7Z9V2_9GAMM|nr:hypothetical protein [Fluviicoccus keumensis]RZU47308.1 hypothetical protein EV700_0263 [Fluviicoccus keumensis]
MNRNCRMISTLMVGMSCLSPALADDGYFLTGQQKQELILRGQMHDEEHRLYDIWIVPGYVVPAETAQKGWRKADESLQTYRKPEFFPNLHKYADKTWRFGTRYTLREYTFRGTREAWSKDMKVASGRTQKRVFGWWLAYPWGVLEATTESLFRIGTGIPTGILVAGSAYTVFPAAYVVTPSVVSLGHAAGEGTVFPLAAATWNTMIAPPLAFLGQRPAPQRADGFWMKQVDDPQLKVLIGELASWRDTLSKTQPTAERDAAIKRLEDDKSAQTRDLYARIKVIEQASGEKIAAVRAGWMTGVMAQARTQRQDMVSRLDKADVPLTMLAAQRQQVVTALAVQGWTTQDAEALVAILLGDTPDIVSPQRAADDKTDPVKRVIEVMGKPGS